MNKETANKIIDTVDSAKDGKEILPSEAVNLMISVMKDAQGMDTGGISDGYHTFDELYEHRTYLFIALCKILSSTYYRTKYPIWRSQYDSEGNNIAGWFIMGIGNKDSGMQITYHLRSSKWHEVDFAITHERAPWDGHTSKDVLGRLKQIISIVNFE